jgi:hypothetical protein
LDFDLIRPALNFEELAGYLEKKLRETGFLADTRVKKTENIFIIVVKFSEVMQQLGISSQADQKIKIKFEVDPAPYKNIQFESKTISSYGRNFNLISNTLPTLFAQKTIALKLRPYQKGRDFYDLVWFLAQKNIEPNYKIFEEKKIAIENKKELISELEKIIAASDLKQAAADVSPFLFYPQQAEWILRLPEYIKNFSE